MPMDAMKILIAQPVLMAITSPMAGRLSHKYELRTLTTLGMVIITFGLSFFIFVTPGTNLALIIIDMIILGFGFGLFSSPNTNAVMSSVDKRYYGIASGVLGTMRNIGQNLSMGIAMLVITIFMGNVKITPALGPAFMTSMHVAFIVFVLLCIVGTLASLVRGRARVEA
jgi:MFS family permease